MDTSGVIIGAILRAGIDGTYRPVAYYSHKLKPAEMRYTVTEQESLAMVEAVKDFEFTSAEPLLPSLPTIAASCT